MASKTLLTALLAMPTATLVANAARADALSLGVRETAGIRRGNFPVQTFVQIGQGRLQDATQVRLLLDQQEVPVQARATARWPDGSIRELDLNFNASIDPLSERRFRLEFGAEVKPATVQSERLEVVETGEGLQVGKLCFSRQPASLLQSVAFGREIVGDGLNAFTVIDADGEPHPLVGDGNPEILKAGPLAVRIRYAGTLKLAAGYIVPFTITLDIPNSKSWVRYGARVEDPGRRIRELALHTSLRLGPLPWTWDFGTGSWTYGVFRDAADSAELKQLAGARSDWQISTGVKEQLRPYERAADSRPARAEGWGHLQSSDRAVAFAVEDFARTPGEYSIEIDGEGQLAFRHTPEKPGVVRKLVVYQHYVASPVPIGAATSPVAMSSPLLVNVEPEKR